MVVSIDDMLRQEDVIYVFGYGSLTWKPDFDSDRQFVGYIRGYERRFWQGSVHHRGTNVKPGRVLTLTKVPNAKCWGLVFEVRGKEKITACLDKLCLREQSLGHYEVSVVPVYTAEESSQPLNAIVYHALPGNDLYTGESTEEEIAFDISTCHGVCGHNLEYLLRLTDFLRDQAPEDDDHHVFGVERLVRQRLRLPNKTWKDLMELSDFRRIVDGETDVIMMDTSSLVRSNTTLCSVNAKFTEQSLSSSDLELNRFRSDSELSTDSTISLDSELSSDEGIGSSFSDSYDCSDDELSSSDEDIFLESSSEDHLLMEKSLRRSSTSNKAIDERTISKAFGLLNLQSS